MSFKVLVGFLAWTSMLGSTKYYLRRVRSSKQHSKHIVDTMNSVWWPLAWQVHRPPFKVQWTTLCDLCCGSLLLFSSMTSWYTVLPWTTMLPIWTQCLAYCVKTSGRSKCSSVHLLPGPFHISATLSVRREFRLTLKRCLLWSLGLHQKNTKELRSFLGLAGYYRKFVKHFGIISKPLTNLLKKNITFCWTQEHDTTFQCLKTTLSQAPV